MTRKTVGIVGGMGTAAGVHFATRLVELNRKASSDVQHASFILHSEPSIPDRTSAFMQQGSSPVLPIARALNRLADSGAGFGVIICNTAHIYLNEIESCTRLPVVSMIETTVRSVAESGVPRVGLLATTATARSGMYQTAFGNAGIGVVVPDEAMQAILHAAIYDTSYGLKATGNRPSAAASTAVQQVAAELERVNGVTHLVLGCTELSMLRDAGEMARWTLIDPVDLLAYECLSLAGTLN